MQPIDITARLPAVPEPELRLCLVQAVSRGERMDTTLQKATELGISEIQPLLSERVEVKLPAGRVEKRMLHWHGVIASACEQSGRATLPVLHHPVALSDWLAGEKPRQGRVLHPGADSSLLDDLAADQPITLIVGPEGGFSDTEIRVMTVAGIRPVHFGRRILRTETAGPAAIAALQFQLGDLG
jgi:16S rRNA (uracil1498-N3)-methyltransferase